jgi:hypothetical protein
LSKEEGREGEVRELERILRGRWLADMDTEFFGFSLEAMFVDGEVVVFISIFADHILFPSARCCNWYTGVTFQAMQLMKYFDADDVALVD